MSSRKNIVFLLPDQLRADYLSCYGAGHLRTPNIDAIAEGGSVYLNAYATSPLCVPSRANMLLGSTPWEHGVFSNQHWIRPDYRACGIETWPDRLGSTGYDTAAFGKMHFTPWDAKMGFGFRKIAEDKRHIHIQDDYADYLAAQGRRKRHGREYPEYARTKGAYQTDLAVDDQIDQWVAREACKWIENRNSERPFAMMVGFPSPHDPYDADPQELERIDPQDIPSPLGGTPESNRLRPSMVESYRQPWSDVDYETFTEGEKRKIRHHYSALVQQLDKAVGRIVASLSAAGVLDNTVIIFSSDHGDLLGDFDLIGKKFFFEPSVRVPLIISGPDILDTESEALVSVTDIYDTILEIAEYPDPRLYEHSLCSVAEGRRSGHEYLSGVLSLGTWITDGRWKLAEYRNGISILTDLQNDPFEQRNVIDEPSYASILARLRRETARGALDGAIAGNADKLTIGVGNINDTAFGQRGWDREYPGGRR